MSRVGRAHRWWAVAAAAVVLSGVAGPALAGAVARALAPAAASAGTWGAAGAPVGGTPVTGTDYVVRFAPGNPTVPPSYFEVVNTGSLALSAQTYRALNVRPLNGNAPPTVTLEACIGGRYERLTAVCVGGAPLTLTNTDQGATAAALTIPAGGRVEVRAAPSRLANYPLEYQTIVTITVSRSQAQAGRTTTS
jgi:hypothetical protein